MKRKYMKKTIKAEPRKNEVSLDMFPEEYFMETKKYSSEHPKPEQLLIREAVKWLTPKQKQVWEMYNFDCLTEDEIAKKLGIDRTSVQDRIRGAEKKITKWVKSNMGAYNLLKRDYND